jgi:hypothetical protein
MLKSSTKKCVLKNLNWESLNRRARLIDGQCNWKLENFPHFLLVVNLIVLTSFIKNNKIKLKIKIKKTIKTINSNAI